MKFRDINFLSNQTYFALIGLKVHHQRSKISLRSPIFWTINIFVLIAHFTAFYYIKSLKVIEKKYFVERVQNDSNTSIAFYVVLGASMKIPPAEDLIGRFWEYQLPDFKNNYTIDYVSDGPMQHDGIDVFPLPPDITPGSDRQFCKRAPAIWQHFLENYPNTHWFFRGTHDTFINLTGLDLMLKELESKIDPMHEWGLVYNVHEYGYMLYPHGGTGYLFSHYAVERFVEHIGDFYRMCWASADDVALGPFLKSFGIDILEYQSDKFIVTWPNTQNDVILKKRFGLVKKCPAKGYKLFANAPYLKPCHIKTAVSMHMHHVPMDKAVQLIYNSPSNFYVTYDTPNDPRYCYI